MSVKVDKDTCIGCGSCVSICDKTFEMKDGKAHVKAQPEEVTCEKEAESACPVHAISIS